MSAELKVVRNRFARTIFGVTSSSVFVKRDSKHTGNYNFGSDFVTKILDSFSADDFTGGEGIAEKAYLLVLAKVRNELKRPKIDVRRSKTI